MDELDKGNSTMILNWFAPRFTPGQKWVIAERAQRAIFFFSFVAFEGIISDYIAHLSGQVGRNESPFTTAHTIMYVGLLGIAWFLLPPFLVNLHYYYLTSNRTWRRENWRNSVPLDQQGWVMVFGAVMTFAGVISDFLFHYVWGFEVGAQSQYSPTHLLMGLGLVCLFGGVYTDLFNTRPIGKLTWKDWTSVAGLCFAFVIITLLFHHFNPAELTWQAKSGNLQLYQYNDSSPDQLLKIEPGEMMSNFQDRSIMPGILNYLFVGGIILPGIILVTATRHKYHGLLVVLLFFLQALPAVIMKHPFMLLPAILLGVAVALLLEMFPLYRLPNFWRVYIFTCGIPILMYTFYTIPLAVMGELWWAVYAIWGVPIILLITGLMMGSFYILTFNLKEDIRLAPPETAE